MQSPYSLGLAQIEEVCDAIEELNRFKAERLGAENWRSIAFTDSFDNQGQYTLATAFKEIYMQPTGEVPLTGLGSQIPFFRRLIDWLGIKVQAEAREQYKSFIAQYTAERLSEPQAANQKEILNSLNTMMLQRIANNRFGQDVAAAAVADIQSVAQALHGADTSVVSNAPLASPLEPSERPDGLPESEDSPQATETSSNALTSVPEAVSKAVDALPMASLSTASPAARKALDKVQSSRRGSESD